MAKRSYLNRWARCGCRSVRQQYCSLFLVLHCLFVNPETIRCSLRLTTGQMSAEHSKAHRRLPLPLRNAQPRRGRGVIISTILSGENCSEDMDNCLVGPRVRAGKVFRCRTPTDTKTPPPPSFTEV